MYLMPLNFTLKMVKMSNFMLCIHYHTYIPKKKTNPDLSWEQGEGRENVTETVSLYKLHMVQNSLELVFVQHTKHFEV